jgi:large subunit ribosomal protein L10
MDRNEKAQVVTDLRETLSGAGAVVITRNLGMTVAQSTALRNKMREAGAAYKVTKNRLARIALDGTPYTGISDLLTGPTALATSDDAGHCRQGDRGIRQDDRQDRNRRWRHG